MSRTEEYYRYLATGQGSIPKPVTREEQYLYTVCSELDPEKLAFAKNYSEQMEALVDAADALVDEAEAVKDSIPEDYSTLSADVTELKSEIQPVNTSPKGKVIAIDDAIVGQDPVYLPTNATVYGRNMYPINAVDRTSNGVTFDVSDTDPNTVTIKANSNASSNAYSYGTINASNATMLLDPGNYYFYMYADTDKDIRMYANIISYSSGTSLGSPSTKANTLYVLTLSEKAYVGVRIQVAKNISTSTDIVTKVYCSKVIPDEVYYPYEAPNGKMHNRSVVICENATDYVTYHAYFDSDKLDQIMYYPLTLKVATFNCGDYSGDGGYQGDVNVPTGDFTAYANYISGLDADILFTQEDREYWDISNAVTMKTKLYDYLYANGGVVSVSTSHGNAMAKGIYTNQRIVIGGKYTFNTNGTTEQGGSTYFFNSFTYYILKLQEKDVLLISVHLAPKEWNTTARKAQITELLNFISSMGIDCVVIAGDLNVWDDELDMFSGYVLANCGIYGDIDTYYGETDHPFDNIIVTPNIKMRDVKVYVNDDFKDHYALSAMLTFNN